MTPPAPRKLRSTGLTTSRIGAVILLFIVSACLITLYWSTRYYDTQDLRYNNLPLSPSLDYITPEAYNAALDPTLTPPTPPASAKPAEDVPFLHHWMGTDRFGRSLFWRCMLGGAISMGIGLAAAFISVFIGTAWGLISGYCGGRIDSAMMRFVDVLYSLPYILLVILLVIVIDGFTDAYRSSVLDTTRPPGAADYNGNPESDELKAARIDYARRKALFDEAVKELGEAQKAALALPPDSPQKAAAMAALEPLDARTYSLDPRPWLFRIIEENRWIINISALLFAIGSVSWLTLARVIRGQVLSLKAQPFVEAARAMGCGPAWIMGRHILPNLIGPIIVYSTLTIPQAILQESFLSFLGIGVKTPVPSWGNLAADGLSELNPITSYPWLIAWPCILLVLTLLALNFLGDGLRDYFDPKARQRA